MLFLDVDCEPRGRDAAVVAVYDCVRAQDLQVLVLAVNFDCVLGLVEDGGPQRGLRLPANDEFCLVRILVKLLCFEIIQIIYLRELLEMRLDLPNEGCEILSGRLDSLDAVLVGHLGPVDCHLNLTSVNHMSLCYFRASIFISFKLYFSDPCTFLY